MDYYTDSCRSFHYRRRWMLSRVAIREQANLERGCCWSSGRPWTWRTDLQNRVIMGTFSWNFGRFILFLYFPKNHTTQPQKILYPGASYFSLFYFQNPLHECLFILLFSSAQIFYNSRTTANSKIRRYPLPLFIISIGTRSPSMKKENSQVKRCSFFKKIVANRALFRYFIWFFIKNII